MFVIFYKTFFSDHLDLLPLHLKEIRELGPHAIHAGHLNGLRCPPQVDLWGAHSAGVLRECYAGSEAALPWLQHADPHLMRDRFARAKGRK